MSSTEGLYKAVETGLLTTAPDPPQTAHDHLMEIAVSRGFDIPQTNLLEHATHLAALAEIVTYLLRPDAEWERPENGEVGDQAWVSSAFLSNSHQNLRRVYLTDSWNESKLLAVANSWEVLGEMAVYEVPMYLHVISLGASRDGRRHGPLSKGMTHPVSNGLRFQRRDGMEFTKGWKPIFREDSGFDLEEWIEVMTEDDVLTQTLQIIPFDPPKEAKRVREIISRTLEEVMVCGENPTPPDPQFAMCNVANNPCPFRSCCPYFREPSIEGGFIPTTLRA